MLFVLKEARQEGSASLQKGNTSQWCLSKVAQDIVNSSCFHFYYYLYKNGERSTLEFGTGFCPQLKGPTELKGENLIETENWKGMTAIFFGQG